MLVFASVLVVCFGAIDILRLDSPADVKAPSLSLAWQGDSFEFTLQSQEGILYILCSIPKRLINL